MSLSNVRAERGKIPVENECKADRIRCGFHGKQFNLNEVFFLAPESETVELEDRAVVKSVEKRINSRFYDRGRYSPTREKGTRHFYRLIAEFMK